MSSKVPRSIPPKESIPEKHYRQIKAAIVDCGDFFEEPVHDTNFLTWMYGGMHDKGERDRNTKVIRRSNFFRRYLNLKTGETIQLDLRNDPERGVHTAVYIRIIEHKKANNNANATFKPNKEIERPFFYCEFAGQPTRKNKVLAAIRNDGRFNIEDSRVLLGLRADAKLIEDFVTIARIAGGVDRPNGQRKIEPAPRKKIRRNSAALGNPTTKKARKGKPLKAKPLPSKATR
jgi:hypothetical protein